MQTSPSSPAPWCLGLLVGVALQLQQPTLDPAAHYGVVGVAALGVLGARWLWPRPDLARRVCLPVLAAALLGWGSTGWRANAFVAERLDPALEGRDIEVIGQVRGLPQPRAEMVRFDLVVEHAWLGGQAVRLPTRVALAWYAPRRGAAADPEDATESARLPADLRPGERWRMTVRLKAPHGPSNPHGFDLELWLWERGVQAQGYVRNSLREPPPQRLQAASWSVDGWRQQVRSAILARVDDRQLAGIVAALVMGDQAAIDRADWDVFRATGVAHLMSISGLHITLFAWLASRLLRLAWQGSARWTPALCLAVPAQQAGAWGGLALATAYALFAGWGLPAQRTVAMLAVVVVLQQAGRRWPWPQIWLLAMAVVVAGDPWALLQAGFWLSFVAVGLLLASEQRQADAVQPGLGLGPRLWQAARSLGREQWVISLALTPLSLLLFQQVSLVGLLANLLAIAWVTWLVTPLALLGVLLPPLWPLAALLLEALMAVLRPMSVWPHAVLAHVAAPLWCGVAGVLGGLLLVMRWPWYVRVLGLPLLLPVLLWQPPRPAAGQVELLALDVGQGSAVLVRTATHSLLYDAGPQYSRESDAGHRVVVPVLRALGERLNLMVLSHADSDHTGGAAAVRASQPQAAVLASFEPGAPQPAWQICQAGQRWHWDGVSFEVLHPRAQDLPQLRATNPRSCVLQLRTAGAQPRSALLMGDLEAAQEQLLLERPDLNLRADWLLVAHHGSKTSSSAGFLDAVQPQWALVQAGYRNRFGHPAAEVVQRFQARGASVVTTPACGAARWRSDQPDRLHCQRQQARRYWQHPGPPAPGQAGPAAR